MAVSVEPYKPVPSANMGLFSSSARSSQVLGTVGLVGLQEGSRQTAIADPRGDEHA